MAYVSHGFADDVEGVRLKCSPQLEAATFAAGGRHHTWEYSRHIDVPVLVVSGKTGPDQGPASMAPLIAEELPRGAMLRLDRVDHFGPMSHPDLIGQVITDAMGTRFV
jgi:pimeloyl-ACP methyl ester carboxylesterase